jgi:hypothetical protein
VSDTGIEDLPFLMALRVQGICGPERAAAATGSDEDAASTCLCRLVSSELAVERTGRVAGFTLTPAGHEALDALLAGEGLRTCAPLHDCYERFLQLNPRVLKLSSEWQVRSDGGVEVPNDHSDEAYDTAVIDRLIELHGRTRGCLKLIAECAPRFATYAPRLDACVDRLCSGDRAGFTAPLAESYHTVWFELHQDLLLTLGLEREE